MPLSLKKQRKSARSSDSQHAERKLGRKLAAEILVPDNKRSLRAVSRLNGVSRNVLAAIKTSIASHNTKTFKILTSPQKKPGAQPILSLEEEKMIVAHCLKAATREFALKEDDLKGIMGGIASDGRA